MEILSCLLSPTDVIMRRDSDLKLSLLIDKDELLRNRMQTSLSLYAKRWSIYGLFGQDISSLSNFSYHEQ